MIWTKRNREADRYYLLPGMARSNRRKHRQLLVASVIVGTMVSLAFGFLLYLMSRSH